MTKNKEALLHRSGPFFLLALLFSCLYLSSCGDGNKTSDTVYDSMDSLALAGKATPELELLSERIVANPNDHSLYFQRGSAFRQFGNMQLALKDFKRAFTIDSTNADYAVALAQIYFDKPDPDTRAGLGVMRKYLGYRSNEMEALWKMAELSYIAKQHKESLEVLNRILQINVQDERAYFMKGMNWKETGNAEKAISSFQTAVEIDPTYYEAFMQLGLMFDLQEDPICLRYFDNALALNDTSTRALYGKAKYFQDNERLGEAIDAYRSIVLIDRQHPDALYNLGTIYYGIDSVEKALRHFEMATKVAPGRAMAYYGKGLCAEELGNTADAVVFYQQALNLNADLLEASDRLANLAPQ